MREEQMFDSWILLSQTFLMNQFIQFTNVLLKLPGRERYQCNSTKCSCSSNKACTGTSNKYWISWKSSIFLGHSFQKVKPIFILHTLFYLLLWKPNFATEENIKKWKCDFLSHNSDFITCNCEFIWHDSEKRKISEIVSLYLAILRRKIRIAKCKLVIVRKKYLNC